MKSRVLKSVVIFVLLATMMFALAACGVPSASPTAEEPANDNADSQEQVEEPAGAQTEEAATPAKDYPDQEYIMVTFLTNFPLYVDHDIKAFEAWGEKMGVKYSVVGPADADTAGVVSALEQVIAQKPAGLLVNGIDDSLTPAINAAVEAGINVVLYDGDVPSSNRTGHIGSNWYNIGVEQGKAMVELLGGKGKVAYMGIVGLPNMEQGFQGMLDVFADYPEIEVVGKYSDNASIEEAAKVTKDIMTAYPDINGICGFDAMSGPGIGTAIKEEGKAGQIKVTTVDWQPEHLQLVKEGVIDVLIGQKRELFTSIGAQWLFDAYNSTVQLTSNDKAAGLSVIPNDCDAGMIIINKDNVDTVIANY